MLKYCRRKIIIILLSFIVLSGALFLTAIHSVSDKLSKTTRVEANILLVEGWLSWDALDMAYDEFTNNEYDHIVTTGIDFILHEYYLVSMNGYLIFYPPKMISPNNEIRSHSIEIDAYGELGGENSSQFNVFINDSLISDFSADRSKRKYMVKWLGKLTDIDSIIIQFVNDEIGDYGDRNLYVKGITIDNYMTIPYQGYSEYDISELDGKRRIVNNYNSSAQLARRHLVSMGLDSSEVIAIPGERVRLNRTLSSVLAFRDWLKISGIEVKGINIVTIGTHAKRTWMTYNKILDKKYNIGIIALPDNKARDSRTYRVLNTIREVIGIIYYWFILLPY